MKDGKGVVIEKQLGEVTLQNKIHHTSLRICACVLEHTRMSLGKRERVNKSV